MLHACSIILKVQEEAAKVQVYGQTQVIRLGSKRSQTGANWVETVHCSNMYLAGPAEPV